MDYISQANVGGTTYAVGLPNVYINSKGNFNIETSAEIGNTSKGKINIESMHDIQLKPGDDIVLYSHHRAADKQDEVTVKVANGEDEDDIPVKLQLNAASLTISTKDKTGNNANVFDVNVNSDTDQKGYLKVRAQAIDLRCEDHGGIALQPKGADSNGNMNKIKFEHGGGDGLEFGTFNAEKTSIFTDEYRFNKDGVWKMATRVKEESDKADAEDNTTAYKYQKQADDFYDVINDSDVTATTEDIIKTANMFNNKYVSGSVTTDGIKFSTHKTAGVTLLSTESAEGVEADNQSIFEVTTTDSYYWHEYADTMTPDTGYEMRYSDIASMLGMNYNNFCNTYGVLIEADDEIGLIVKGGVDGEDLLGVLNVTKGHIPGVKIESVGDITLDPEDKLKLKGTLDFGSTFNFGETDDGIETLYKKTKNNNVKDCGKLKVVAVNNSSSSWSLPVDNLKTPANTSISSGSSEVIAECSIYDIIKLVDYFKNGDGVSNGPWASQS